MYDNNVCRTGLSKVVFIYVVIVLCKNVLNIMYLYLLRQV